MVDSSDANDEITHNITYLFQKPSTFWSDRTAQVCIAFLIDSQVQPTINLFHNNITGVFCIV